MGDEELSRLCGYELPGEDVSRSRRVDLASEDGREPLSNGHLPPRLEIESIAGALHARERVADEGGLRQSYDS